MLRQRSIVASCFRVVGRLKGSETGVTLIETLVALALIGIISVAFLSGLATAAKATFIADEQATAESLARSELECVKSQDYIYAEEEMPVEYQNREQRYGFVMPPGYSVEITTIPIDPVTGQPLPSGGDDGIQKIEVKVKRDGEEDGILTVHAYKVGR